KENNEIILAFKIENIGETIANPVYWKIDSDSSDTNPERIEPVILNQINEKNSWTKAYMKLIYSQPGDYNPRVIVDFDNLINEKNETNNEASILITI
ncbi:MAG: CARDB domain-containing protein, partial [Nanoarchaeota archaeon]